jgi:hypothetical protein
VRSSNGGGTCGSILYGGGSLGGVGGTRGRIHKTSCSVVIFCSFYLLSRVDVDRCVSTGWNPMLGVQATGNLCANRFAPTRTGATPIRARSTWQRTATHMLRSTITTVSAPANSSFRGSITHPTQPLCTLRVRRHRRLTQHSLPGGLSPQHRRRLRSFQRLRVSSIPQMGGGSRSKPDLVNPPLQLRHRKAFAVIFGNRLFLMT